MFELSECKTLLNQAQMTWELVRNDEQFELSGIRINGCLLKWTLANSFRDYDYAVFWQKVSGSIN